ncbi:hypothetical protein ACFQZC_01970 [Streptacidiphilus monticola]
MEVENAVLDGARNRRSVVVEDADLAGAGGQWDAHGAGAVEGQGVGDDDGRPVGVRG